MISRYWSLKLSDYGLNIVVEEMTLNDVTTAHEPLVDSELLSTTRSTHSSKSHCTRTDYGTACTKRALSGVTGRRRVCCRLCHVSDFVSTAVDQCSTNVVGWVERHPPFSKQWVRVRMRVWPSGAGAAPGCGCGQVERVPINKYDYLFLCIRKIPSITHRQEHLTPGCGRFRHPGAGASAGVAKCTG
jgi:hypothetical protein